MYFITATPKFGHQNTLFTGEIGSDLSVPLTFVAFPAETSYTITNLTSGKEVLMADTIKMSIRDADVIVLLYGAQTTMKGKEIMFIIQNLRPEYEGKYNLRCTNNIGYSDFIFTITVGGWCRL